MIRRARAGTAVVQTLQPTPFANEGAELTATWTGRMALVVLYAKAIQDEARVDAVRSSEDRFSVSEGPRGRASRCRRLIRSARFEGLNHASQRWPRAARARRWGGRRSAP